MSSDMYVRLSELQLALGQVRQQGLSNSGYDPRLARIARSVSRDWDSETHGMHLGSVTEVRYFAGHCNAPEPRRLWVVPLIDITEIKYDDDGNYTYGTTLVANTDYWTEKDPQDPDGPIWCLWLNPESEELTTWPTVPRSIRITGRWGHSHRVEATGQTVQNTTQISSSGTTLELGRDHGIDPGETLVIESEQLRVAERQPNASNTDLVVERGVNGTTAAAHLNGVAVYRRVYADDIVDAVLSRCRSKWHAEYSGAGQANDIQWTGQGNYDLFPAWVRKTRQYQIRQVV